MYMYTILSVNLRKAWGDSTDVGTEEELWGTAIVDAKSSSPKTVSAKCSMDLTCTCTCVL